VAELRRRAFEHDSPIVEDANPIAQLFRGVQAMRRKQDGDTIPRGPNQQPFQPSGYAGI